MPDQRTIRVLITDDSVIVRAGIRSNLHIDPSIHAIGEARTGREAIERTRELQPDVILMDVRMPDMDGITATRELTREQPDARVLILTWSEDGQNLVNAMRAGARGYLVHATFTAEDLCAAVHTVHEGGALISPFLAPYLIDAFRRTAAPAEPDSRLATPLTARELEVLDRIRAGRTNREIAAELGVSDKTVKNHINNIYSKLNVSDRDAAAQYEPRPR